MYFDRLLFGAVFATLLGTAALAGVERLTPSRPATATATAATPALERAVVVGQRETAPRS